MPGFSSLTSLTLQDPGSPQQEPRLGLGQGPEAEELTGGGPNPALEAQWLLAAEGHPNVEPSSSAGRGATGRPCPLLGQWPCIWSKLQGDSPGPCQLIPLSYLRTQDSPLEGLAA